MEQAAHSHEHDANSRHDYSRRQKAANQCHGHAEKHGTIIKTDLPSSL
jgi:hypothetical protein